MMLSTTPLSFSRGNHFTLHTPELTIRSGQVLSLLGPNGAGKSTLLQLFSRFITPDSGTIFWDAEPIQKFSQRNWASKVAVVPQDTGESPPLTLFEYALLGRTPHRGILQPFTKEDFQAVALALTDCGVYELRDQLFSELSGGQRQRARIARALAQGSRLLILDEPTNHLDLSALQDIAMLIRELASNGMSFITSLHYLDVASYISTHVAFVSSGTVQPIVESQQALTPEAIFEHFGVTVEAHQRNDGSLSFHLSFPSQITHAGTVKL